MTKITAGSMFDNPETFARMAVEDIFSTVVLLREQDPELDYSTAYRVAATIHQTTRAAFDHSERPVGEVLDGIHAVLLDLVPPE